MDAPCAAEWEMGMARDRRRIRRGFSPRRPVWRDARAGDDEADHPLLAARTRCPKRPEIRYCRGADNGPADGLWGGLPVLFKQHTLQHGLGLNTTHSATRVIAGVEEVS